MEIRGLADQEIVFIVEEDGKEVEITDMFYFEEQGFHNNNDCFGYSGTKILGIKFRQSFSV